MDISLEKWGYFLARKPFNETFSSPEVQEQLKEFKEKTDIDFVKELLPLLGTHISMGYYAPNHQFDSPMGGAKNVPSKAASKPICTHYKPWLKPMPLIGVVRTPKISPHWKKKQKNTAIDTISKIRLQAKQEQIKLW